MYSIYIYKWLLYISSTLWVIFQVKFISMYSQLTDTRFSKRLYSKILNALQCFWYSIWVFVIYIFIITVCIHIDLYFVWKLVHCAIFHSMSMSFTQNISIDCGYSWRNLLILCINLLNVLIINKRFIWYERSKRKFVWWIIF